MGIRQLCRSRPALLAVYAIGFVSATSCVNATDTPITALAFSPDGQRVVSGSQSGIQLLSWPELLPLQSLPTVVENVHDICFSPQGDHFVVAGGTPAVAGLVQRFTWPECKPRDEYKGHDDSVFSLVWLDDATFATASLDHSIRIWAVNQPQARQELHGHSRGITTLTYLATERLLVSGGLDNVLRVWNLASGDVVRTLKNHTAPVQCVEVRPSATGLPMVASIGEDRTLRFWQPTLGRLVRFKRFDSVPLAMAWSPDGSRVAVATADGCVQFVDPDTLQIEGRVDVPDAWVYSLAAHPSGEGFVIGQQDGKLKRVEHISGG